jgi:hypothetical protein
MSPSSCAAWVATDFASINAVAVLTNMRALCWSRACLTTKGPEQADMSLHEPESLSQNGAAVRSVWP